MSDETPTKPPQPRPRPRTSGDATPLPKRRLQLRTGGSNRPITIGAKAKGAIPIAAAMEAPKKPSSAKKTPPSPAQETPAPIPPTPMAQSAAPATETPLTPALGAEVSENPKRSKSLKKDPKEKREKKERKEKKSRSRSKLGPVPAPTDGGRFSEAAIALVRRYEAELATKPRTARAARLHYAIGGLCETVLKAKAHALSHYRSAYKKAPEDPKTIRAARRSAIADGNWAAALSAIAAEIKVTPSPKGKAALHHQAGSIHLDQLADRASALAAFQSAHALDKTNPRHLLAWERADDGPEIALASATHQANLAVEDPALQGAWIARQAHLVEVHNLSSDAGPTVSAAADGLLQRALEHAPTAPAILSELQRLAHAEERWGDLVGWLSREVELSSDPASKAMTLVQIARLKANYLGDPTAALEALAGAAVLLPEAAVVLDEQAALFESTERWESLVEVLERRAADTGLSTHARLALYERLGALNTHRLGRHEAGAMWHKHALELAPDHVPSLHALGGFLGAEGRWQDLIAMLSAEAEATTVDRRRAAAHHRIAAIYERQLDTPEMALSHYLNALTLAPRDVGAFGAALRLSRSTGRWREAAELLRRAVATPELIVGPGDRALYLYDIAVIYEDRLGEFDLAIETYQTLLEDNPDDLRAIRSLHRTATRAQRFDVAVEAIDLELKQTIDHQRRVRLEVDAAIALEGALERPQEAAERLIRALELDPSSREVLSLLGRIYFHMGRWEALLEVYEREAALDSDISDVAHSIQGAAAVRRAHRMGDIARESLGDANKAAAFYQAATRLDPTFTPSADALTRLLTTESRWDALADHLDYQLTHAASPAQTAQLALHLGEIAEHRLNDQQRAARAFESAIDAVPEFVPAAQALDRLRGRAQAWPRLVTSLEERALASGELRQEVASLMHAGYLWRDRLHNPAKAIACFKGVLDAIPGHMPALLALAQLQEKHADNAELASTQQALADAVTGASTKAAFLSELARTLQRSEQTLEIDVENDEALVIEDDENPGSPPALPPLPGSDDEATPVPQPASGSQIDEPTTERDVLESIVRAVPDDLLALSRLEELALADGDLERLIEVDQARLKTEDPLAPLADVRTRLAQSLEMIVSANALAAYQSALAADPESLVASHGYARLAEDMGLADAQVEALRRLAKLQTDGASASKYLVKAAGTALAQDPASDEALEMLSEALRVAPTDPAAADALHRLLLERRQADHLIDLLTAAAAHATKAEQAEAVVGLPRSCQLWVTVAHLQFETRDPRDSGAALASLQQVFGLQPNHTEARLLAAAVYSAERQWPQAADQLSRAVSKHASDDDRQSARLQLASVQSEHLGQPARARQTLNALLGEDPTHQVALRQLFALEEAHGRPADAVDAGARLLAVLPDTAAADAAQVQASIGSIHAQLKDWSLASDALLKAVVVQGPDGAAAASYRGFAEEHGDFGHYADALNDHIEVAAAHGKPPATVFEQLAAVQVERLNAPADAIHTLRLAVATWPDDVDLRTLLADQLKAGGHAEGALSEQLKLVASNVARASSWRDLASTLHAVKRRDEARVALRVVGFLGEATPQERTEISNYPPRPGHARPGSFGPAVIRRLKDARGATAVADLVELVGHAAHKLDRFKPSFQDFGLSSRDRLTSRSSDPTREFAERIAAIYDVEDFDLYVHARGGPLVSLELGDKPSILLAQRAVDMGPSSATYALALAMGYINQSATLLMKVGDRDLAILLAAGARTAVAGFGEGLTTSHFIETLSKGIAKAIPRRHRKALEQAAFEYARGQQLPALQQWMSSVHTRCQQAAAILCDDVAVAVGASADPTLSTRSTALQTLADSDAARQMLAFWGAETAHALRNSAGLFSKTLL